MLRIGSKKHVLSFRLSKRLGFLVTRSCRNTTVRFADYNQGKAVSLSADWLWSQRFVIHHQLPGFICEDHQILDEDNSQSDEGVYVEVYEFSVLQPRLSELLNIAKNCLLPVPVVRPSEPELERYVSEPTAPYAEFEVSGKVYRVTRERVNSLSPVFSAMISERWSSNKSVHHLQEEARTKPFAGDFFGFLSEGTVHITTFNLLGLLILANKYMVDDLVSLCASFIESHVLSGKASIAAVLRLWLHTKHFMEQDFLLDFLRMNMTDVLIAPDFLNLDLEDIETLLGDTRESTIVLENEELVLNSLLKWDRKNRLGLKKVCKLVDAKALQPGKLLLYERNFDEEDVLEAFKFHACPFDVRYQKQLNCAKSRRLYLNRKCTGVSFPVSSSCADRYDTLWIQQSYSSDSGKLKLSFTNIGKDCGGIDLAVVLHSATGHVHAVVQERLVGANCSHDFYLRLDNAQDIGKIDIVPQCMFPSILPAKRKLNF